MGTKVQLSLSKIGIASSRVTSDDKYVPSLIISWARSISVFLQLSVFLKKSSTLSVDKSTACGPAAKCIPLRSIWVRKTDLYTILLEITLENETATLTAKPFCHSPFN